MPDADPHRLGVCTGFCGSRVKVLEIASTLDAMGTRVPAAIIASRIFSPEGGAAAFRLSALRDALETAGYETTVFTTQPPHRVPSTRQVRRLPVLRDTSGSVRGYVQYASFDIPLFFRLLFAPRSAVTIAEPPPTTGASVRLACALRRTPYIYFAADVTSVAAAGIGVNRKIVRILRAVESWVLRGALVVLAVSEGVRSEVVRLGVDPKRIVVVGTGVDTDTFRPDGDRVATEASYLVYAGTMSEIQGASVFVDAFVRTAERYPQARLILFGQGTDELMLRKRAAAVGGGRIEFPGVVTGAEVAKWLRGAQAALASMAPGRGYEFAHSTKALAGLASGTPVIYAGTGVTGDLVRDHRLGWTVPWDIDAVASAMGEALASAPTPERRAELAAWAAENFSLRRVAADSVSAINRALHPAA